jgi:hypothetical protein
MPSTFIQRLIASLNHTKKPASEDASFQTDARRWFSQHARHKLLDASLFQRLKWLTNQHPDLGRFHEAFVRACVDRRFFVTKQGFMSIGPDAMKESNIIVILFRGNVPYLVRAVDPGYKFLEECCVPGLMDGEAVQIWKDQGSQRSTFELI